MPNPAYKRGADRERRVVELLQTRGYVAGRIAGSKGPFDVFGLRVGERPLLVQVKSGKTEGTYAGTSPAERDKLKDAAVKAGARPVVLAWAPYKQPRWLFLD